MSEQERESDPQSPMIKRIEDLANILQNSSVGEIELTEGGTEVIIRRQSEAEEGILPQQQTPMQRTPPDAKVPDPPAKEDRSRAITAPVSGIFYTSPTPGAPPFVKVGDVIQPEQVIALIEAMKVFNEIRPDMAGHLVQVSAESGLLVKKGDVLFRVDPE